MGVREKIRDLLQDGVSPEELARAVASGTAGGVFPVPLATTVASLLLCALARCGKAATALGIVVNFACTPLNVISILPIIAAGDYLFGGTTDLTELRRCKERKTLACLKSLSRIFFLAHSCAHVRSIVHACMRACLCVMCMNECVACTLSPSMFIQSFKFASYLP